MAAAGASSAPEVLSSNVHARAAALELEQEPPAAGKTRQRCCAQLPALCPDSRRRALLGPLFLVAGAWMIASANACAKVLYLHEAVSVASLFLLRSAVVYAMNAMFIVAGVGGAPRSSVVGVLLLRCGSRRTQLLTLLRGLMGTGGIGLLNLACAPPPPWTRTSCARLRGLCVHAPRQTSTFSPLRMPSPSFWGSRPC